MLLIFTTHKATIHFPFPFPPPPSIPLPPPPLSLFLLPLLFLHPLFLPLLCPSSSSLSSSSIPSSSLSSVPSSFYSLSTSSSSFSSSFSSYSIPLPPPPFASSLFLPPLILYPPTSPPPPSLYILHSTSCVPPTPQSTPNLCVSFNRTALHVGVALCWAGRLAVRQHSHGDVVRGVLEALVEVDAVGAVVTGVGDLEAGGGRGRWGGLRAAALSVLTEARVGHLVASPSVKQLNPVTGGYCLSNN